MKKLVISNVKQCKEPVKNLLEVICRIYNNSNGKSRITTTTSYPVCLLDDNINNRSYIWISIELTDQNLVINASIDGKIEYNIYIPYTFDIYDNAYVLLHEISKYECYWSSCGVLKLEQDKDVNRYLLELLSKGVTLLEDYINSEYEFLYSKYIIY